MSASHAFLISSAWTSAGEVAPCGVDLVGEAVMDRVDWVVVGEVAILGEGEVSESEVVLFEHREGDIVAE